MDWKALFRLAVCIAVLALCSCSEDIDREFGPSALQGDGALPGRVITTMPQS